MKRSRFACGAKWGLLLLFFGITGSRYSGAQDVTKVCATLNAVGTNGKGNEAAARAWTELVQFRAAQIPAILQNMDQANAMAANWYRAAIDTIGERELREGGQLPTAELEAFAKDTSHASKARVLAYDWLTRVDASAPDRLIPGMIDDPGLEFRRDAVARVIKAAADAETAQHKDAAIELYRKAFTKARDIAQIKEIGAKLTELGAAANVSDHLGFILQWKLIGPFDNTGSKGFAVAYPPEKEFNPSASYSGKSGEIRWIDYKTEDEFGLIDLNKALGKANGVVAYAAAEFDSPRPREIELRTGTGNANKVWLNGEQLNESKPYHAGDQIDQFVGRGKLKAGKNLILIKILQNEQTESWAQDWKFQLRVCDSLGTAVLAANRANATDRTPGGE